MSQQLLPSTDSGHDDAANSAHLDAANPATVNPKPDFKGQARLQRLSLPVGVGRRIRWRYAAPIAAMHVFALLACVPWLFSWSGAALCFVGIHLFGSGINIGYHRLLTHRSFKCPEWVERMFVFFALFCMEDTPATWVATHRQHHKDSDEQPDPHSPLVNFLWGHMGWLVIDNSQTQNWNWYERFAPDVIRKPFYLWLQRGFVAIYIYLAHALAFTLAGFVVGWAIDGTARAGWQLAASWLVWAVILRTVLVWHITWSVNSLSHLFGYRNYDTPEHSRNNWLVTLLANGEGWHNNHHRDPTSASNWHRWWEFDLTYVGIKTLEKLGLAYDIIPSRMKAD